MGVRVRLLHSGLLDLDKEVPGGPGFCAETRGLSQSNR